MKNRLEIIYILPDVDAGVSSIVRNLLEFRSKSDLVYKVILTHEIENTETVRINYFFNTDYQIKFEYSKYDNLNHVFYRLKNYITNKMSVIVANDGLEIRMCNFLKLTNPLVYIIHGDFEYYYIISCLNQNVIDSFISYSKHIHNTLKSKLDNVNKEKVQLIYYPVPEKINSQVSKGNKLKIVFVGSLIERKGILLFKPIYKELLRNNVDFDFIIIGSGKLKNYLEIEFKQCKNVFLLGQLSQNDVNLYYAQSHILLFPTYSEGLPNVIVEAMKFKCVPIVSEIPSGVPDLIDHYSTGIMIEQGNIIAFANAIIELDTNRDLLDKISKNARQKSIEMFDPNRQAKLYEFQLINLKLKVEKKFHKYPMGGILNIKWFPNILVKYTRKILKVSKL